MKRILMILTCLCSLALVISAQTGDALRKKVFEKVWSTVNEKFYDPNFNGADWKKVHDDYLPRALAAKNEDDFYKVMTEMLGLLKVSHMEIGSDAQLAKMKQTPATTGVGLRMVEGRLTIVRLLRDFPAIKAGLKTGYIITGINGTQPKDVDEAKLLLSGSPATKVHIKYLDENDVEHEIDVERQSLTNNDRGKMAGINFYALFDSRRLEGGIGYMSFTSFVPFLNDRIAAAFDEFKDAPAIIIDVRGNGGGEDSVWMKIADRLFVTDTQLMLIRTRTSELKDEKAHGSKNAYKGKIVILVDEFSESASEEFAAGLQEAGRATIIGTKTSGQDLDADVTMLPDGGILIYALGQPHTPKGVVIEGRGVIPDVSIYLKRSDLLAGRDTQIAGAVDHLLKKGN